MNDTTKWRWSGASSGEPQGPESLVPPSRLHLLDDYAQLLTEANRRINLVSRSAVPAIRSDHIPHCLTICGRAFRPGSLVADFGTGGGLPAVPLAIAFPDVQFVAIDSTGKKVALLRVMARKLGLQNLTVWYGRAEQWDGQATHVVSRATAPLRKLWQWTRRGVAWDSVGSAGGPVSDDEETQNDDEPPYWASGLICLKGGDLGREVRALPSDAHLEQWDLGGLYPKSDFAGKYILHVSRREGVALTAREG